MMEVVERNSYEEYAAAELVIADREISDEYWYLARSAVGERNPRVLLGRDPAGRAPGGRRTTDLEVVLNDDERMSRTAIALVRQPYDHRWLLHVVAGTNEPASPHRVVVDAAGQQHLLGPDSTLLLVRDRWYRIRLAQDPSGPISRHSDAEAIATNNLIAEVWLKAKTPRKLSKDSSAVPTLHVEASKERSVERKRAFILAHTYGPYLANKTDSPETASSLAQRITDHYHEFGSYPAGFLLSVEPDSNLLRLSDDDEEARKAEVQRICTKEIVLAGNTLKTWIAAEQSRTGEAGEAPTPSTPRFAQWLGRLGVVMIEDTESGGIQVTCPVHETRNRKTKSFASYVVYRDGRPVM